MVRSITRVFMAWALLAAGISFSSPVVAADDGLSVMLEKLKAAMAMPHRSEKNVARDKNRAPLKAMEFCGLRDDMPVLEFGPGNGWYSELLGPVLQEKGALHLIYKDEWMKKLDGMLALDVMSAVKKHPIDLGWNRDIRKFHVDLIAIDVRDADLALNIREYHNFDTKGAMQLNDALFEALKPGGHYCIIDHTRRHMEPDWVENRRRADPVQVIKEVQASGFRLVDYSPMFWKPDDELRYEVGRKTVTGNTDRFTLLFVKP